MSPLPSPLSLLPLWVFPCLPPPLTLRSRPNPILSFSGYFLFFGTVRTEKFFSCFLSFFFSLETPPLRYFSYPPFFSLVRNSSLSTNDGLAVFPPFPLPFPHNVLEVYTDRLFFPAYPVFFRSHSPPSFFFFSHKGILKGPPPFFFEMDQLSSLLTLSGLVLPFSAELGFCCLFSHERTGALGLFRFSPFAALEEYV